MIKFMGKILGQYCHQKNGSIAVMLGMMIPVLFAALGLGMDLSKAYNVRDQLSQAIDASALAAAASSGDPDQIEERFWAFFDANFTRDSLGVYETVNLNITDDVVAVEALARVPTGFLVVLGYEDLTVRAYTEVKREVRGIEVALVLDNTGSMRSNDNIGALRTASRNFVDILFDRATYDDMIKVALVPYSATVNGGAEMEDLVDNPYTAPYDPADAYAPYDPDDGYAWHGCLIERPYPHDVEDTDVIEGGEWDIFRWASAVDNNWDEDGLRDNPDYCNDRRTPNLGCPTPIFPLTSDQAALLDEIDQLRAWCRGGTMGNLGMAWGIRTLSPQRPFDQGAPYGDKMWRKAIVMMTDGNNQTYKPGYSPFDSDYTAYDRLDAEVLGTDNSGVALGIINDRLTEACEYAKDHNIEIYTITFSSSISENTKDIYRECASDVSKYYDAPTQADLITAFETISRELSNLHIQY